MRKQWCLSVISMNRTLIIQLCQGKDSFPFYGTFNVFLSLVEATGCGAAMLFIQNIAEKETINAKKILFTFKLKPSRSHRTHVF